MPKILLVEDDRDMAQVIQEWLEPQNFTIDVVFDGRSGLEYSRSGIYDVIVLDWDLPGIAGIEICREFRGMGGSTPILMLTAKGQTEDKERGLDSGADDYLTKPFPMKELSARLRALLRRNHALSDNALRVGPLELDPIKHKVSKAGKEIHLLPKDFELLEFLMRHPDQVFSSELLLHRVWSFETESGTNAVRSSIKRLRQLIDDGDDEDKSLIENVRRVGYRLKP